MSKKVKTTHVDWRTRLVFEEVIYANSIAVECLDHALTTNHTSENGTHLVKLHITQPRVSEVCKRIGSTNKLFYGAMVVFRNNLSVTETRNRHIENELLKVVRSTIEELSTREVSQGFETNRWQLLYQDKLCFDLQSMSYNQLYLMDIMPLAFTFGKNQKMGYHKTGTPFRNCLNSADMVQWLMDDISPRVLARMTHMTPV
jgi:hypothetical protein